MATEGVGSDRTEDHAGGGRVVAAHVLRDDVVGGLAGRPGPDTLAAVLRLLDRDDVVPTARELVEVSAALKAVEAVCVAARLAATVALDRALQPEPTRRGPTPLVAGRRAADELAAALGIAPVAASRWVALARRADRDLPAAVDAVSEGRMDLPQLRVVAEVTRGLPAAAVRAVEALALRRCPTSPVARLRCDLVAEAQRQDPGHAARECALGRADRDVVVRASPLPGCRRLVADLPSVAAQAAWSAVNAAATTARDRGRRADGAPEERTLGQLRADLLTALLTGMDDPVDPTAVPTRELLATLAEVQVVVAADTLRGEHGGRCGSGGGAGGNGAGGYDGCGAEVGDPDAGADCGASGGGSGRAGARNRTGCRVDLPASIPGAGPVDAAEARRIAAAARWRRLVVDPDSGVLQAHGRRTHPPPALTGPAAGAVPGSSLADDRRWRDLLGERLGPTPDVGVSRYRPPPSLRRHVHVRDATCLGPACHHTARGTQLDHTVDLGRADARGRPGTTSAGNLGSLCRRAHAAKTHGGWRLTQSSPGSFRWTSPTGRHYERPVRPLVPGW